LIRNVFFIMTTHTIRVLQRLAAVISVSPCRRAGDRPFIPASLFYRTEARRLQPARTTPVSAPGKLTFATTPMTLDTHADAHRDDRHWS
jgi:hypothetical protein